MNKENINIYDYIIIGGGISGLYAAYILSKKFKILVLEKNNFLGGRAEEVKFHNDIIKLGAGIAAKNNKHLLKLLDELKIKYNVAKGDIGLINNSEYYNKQYHNSFIRKIKQKIIELQKLKIKYNHLTFKDFMYKYFDKKYVDNYFLHCEYNDFLGSDVDYHIKYYPISDNSFTSYNIIFLSWTELVNKLINNIKLNKSYMKINYEVKNINNKNNLFIINNDYCSKKIIFALTLKPLIKLTKNLINLDYSKYIDSVPFVRIYTYHKNGHNYNKDRYTILANSNPLQKIVLITDKTIMASYSDGEKALYWKKYLDKNYNIINKNKLIKIVYKYLQEVQPDINKIDDILIKYWEEGVHYFYPMNGKDIKEFLNKLSNPADNIQVVGEILSLRQGWVEGAIESVDRIIN
jgi:protoporphyrinogen oxidase